MKKLILIIILVFYLVAPVFASIDTVTLKNTPYIVLPEVHENSVDAYKQYFDEFFENKEYNVRGLGNESTYAAYAAMSVHYIEEKLGRPMTYSDLMSAAWFSEAGVVWMHDNQHPIAVGTTTALAHQINSYCGGVGVVSCDVEYVLLALGTGWQAFRYNITSTGKMPAGDNIVAMLTSDLQIHRQVRSIGLRIVDLSSANFTCRDAWTVGIMDNSNVYSQGDRVTVGYILWVDYLHTSIGVYTDHQYAVISSCGIRLIKD